MRKSIHTLKSRSNLTIIQIAPAYEGKELGIGEAMLMKAISVSTGRPVKSLKEDLDRLGDIGSVAQVRLREYLSKKRLSLLSSRHITD